MKKEANFKSSFNMANADGQASYKVSSRKGSEEEDVNEANDPFANEADEEDYEEPKGPKKEDLKSNIIFLDEEEEEEEEF